MTVASSKTAPQQPWVRLGASDAAPLGAIFGAIGLLAGGALALIGEGRLPFPICFFKAFTGIPCPTCGSTRALAQLVSLDLGAAFAMNPLAAAAAFLVAAWAVADLQLLPRGRALTVEVSPRLARPLRVATVVLLLANWAYLVAAGR